MGKGTHGLFFRPGSEVLRAKDRVGLDVFSLSVFVIVNLLLQYAIRVTSTQLLNVFVREHRVVLTQNFVIRSHLFNERIGLAFGVVNSQLNHGSGGFAGDVLGVLLFDELSQSASFSGSVSQGSAEEQDLLPIVFAVLVDRVLPVWVFVPARETVVRVQQLVFGQERNDRNQLDDVQQDYDEPKESKQVPLKRRFVVFSSLSIEVEEDVPKEQEEQRHFGNHRKEERD